MLRTDRHRRPLTLHQQILRAMRKRYHAAPVNERPALTASTVYGATRFECIHLAAMGRWPLNAAEIEFIRRPPRSRPATVADVERIVARALRPLIGVHSDSLAQAKKFA